LTQMDEEDLAVVCEDIGFCAMRNESSGTSGALGQVTRYVTPSGTEIAATIAAATLYRIVSRCLTGRWKTMSVNISA
jgi:hypothetical protein